MYFEMYSEDIEGSAAKLLHTYQLLQNTLADHNFHCKKLQKLLGIGVAKGGPYFCNTLRTGCHFLAAGFVRMV